MIHLLLVYLHLIATCAAIGAILACDLRVAAVLADRLRRPEARCSPLRLPAPDAATVRLVAAALGVLIATGVALVAVALQARPDALANPKLQAKIALVALLVLNGAALHRISLPALAGRARLARRERHPTAAARLRDAAVVAGPVAVSHGLWAYCAFLGVARAWNHALPIETVLAVGGGVVLLAWGFTTGVLAAAAAPGFARVTRLPPVDAVAVAVGDGPRHDGRPGAAHASRSPARA